MSLSDELLKSRTIFLDTSPIIYYIEAHPQYGSLVKEVVDSFQSYKVHAFTSVITLTEVSSKPVEKGDEKLATEFTKFLKHGKNIFINLNIEHRTPNIER